MRIAIDIRRINEFGVGTYIWNLVRNLSDVDTHNEYLLLGSQRDFLELGPLGSNFTLFSRDTPAKGWREHGEVESAHKLVTSHLRLVAKIAMGYRGYGLPLNELISEGNVGMMQAVKRFEPERGFRLATYAMWWIRAAIQEYILHSWSLVKMGTTAAQKKLFFNLRKMKNQIKAVEEGDLTPEHVTKIATELNVAEDDVVQMNRRLAAPDHSLNAPLRIDGDGEWQDWLVDETASQEITLAESQELSQRKKLLEKALKVLNPRERRILMERRLKEEPTTLEDLSKEYNISRERVRQIEVRAFEKLQKAIRNSAIEQRLTT
jgi:RNA polymerase sigma-32 factor